MVFVDIETNGEMGERGRIIEIAALRVENGEVTGTFSSLINPGSGIPMWIEKLTGITNKDVAGAPYFDEVAHDLQRLLDGAIFVAHNVRFDYSFVKSHFKALGHEFRPKLFCTVRMSRALYPEYKGHSLEKIIHRHAISTANRHRALDDAEATFAFAKLALEEKGSEAFKANIALQLRTKSLPPNVDETRITALPASPGIYIFRDSDGAPLYVGKSINIQARVRSHFTNDTRIVKEMKLSQRSYEIDFVTTETEIEALLLESATVKELQPLLNRKLRRTTKQSILTSQLNGDGYKTIAIESKDLNELTDTSNIYGVYTSRMQAKAALDSINNTFGLCPKLLGLEKTNGACFRHQLGLCRGACVGKEPAESYNRRVDIALERSRVESWPFTSKIAIKISEFRSLIVNQWIIEGIMSYEFEPTLERITNGFDIDTYKILRSFVRSYPGSVSKLTRETLIGLG